MSYARTYFVKRSNKSRPHSKVEFFVENYGHLLPKEREARICEIGPGMGQVLDHLINSAGYKNAFGLEVDRDLAEIANQKCGGRCHFVESAEEFLENHETSLDLVIMLQVLEHIEGKSAVALLGQIKRSLKPGGILLVEVPNAAHPLTGAATFAADFTHCKSYTNSSLEQVLRMSGFEHISVGTVRAPGSSIARWMQRGVQRLTNTMLRWAYRIYFPADPPLVSVLLHAVARA